MEMTMRLNSEKVIEAERDKWADCVNIEELIAAANDEVRFTLESICRLAEIVRRLETLGATYELEWASGPIMRRVAFGQIVPELYVSYVGDEDFLNLAASLEKPDQIRIAANELQMVMEADGGHRMVRWLSMSNTERRQVISNKPRKIRNASEQVSWLRERLQKEAVRVNSILDAPILFNKRKKGIDVTVPAFVPEADLVRYVRQLGYKVVRE